MQRGHAGAVALRPQNQLVTSAACRPSAIRCLPWQTARRSRKSPLHARGLARTMSASSLPGTSGLAASQSATGSSTPHSRRRRCNAPRSDTGRKKRRPDFGKEPADAFDWSSVQFTRCRGSVKSSAAAVRYPSFSLLRMRARACLFPKKPTACSAGCLLSRRLQTKAEFSLVSACRVGPGNFTPSLSQIRT